MPKDLPADPVLLKQLLEQMLSERESDKGKIVHLEEENALLRQRLFGRKSEQTADPATPQMALFNEAESAAESVDEAVEEEVVAPTKHRGKRKPLPADLPRIEVIHELPEHELTCACGCRKHSIGQEISEQLEIVPMQIRVIKHVRKVYACRDCETAPVTADKPAQLIEKSMASPSVLAMLLTTTYVDGLPLHRFEKVLGRHGVDIPRQTLARWVIQCGEHLHPLLNLMRDRLLESRVIHCDETRVQVLKEPDREPTSQSWMWVQTGGPPDQPVILFDYSTSRAQEVPSRLLEGYRGYLMTDDYAGYNALGAQSGVERLGCWAHARRKFVEAQKVQPKGKTGRADIALNLINKLYGIERDLKEVGDDHRHESRQQNSLPVLAQLQTWLEKTQPQVTAQNALGKAISYLASNWIKLVRYTEAGYCGRACDQALCHWPKRTGYSAIRPRAQRPALNFTVWSRRLKPTAKSPMRGCATHLSACHRQPRLKITKPCCLGTARPHRLAKRAAYLNRRGSWSAYKHSTQTPAPFPRRHRGR